MLSTGITRRLDELGRVVLPMELRTRLELTSKVAVDIWLDGKDIILRKQENACTFCGSTENLEEAVGKLICKSCGNQLKNILK